MLGYFMVATGITLFIPQIAKILQARSATGISFSSFLLDTFATLVWLAYSIRHSFPFSTYGETWFIIIQQFIILVLMFEFEKGRGHALAFMGVFGVLAFAMHTPWIVHDYLLQFLQTLAVPFFISSKIPQIVENYRNKSTGQLAVWTVANNLFGMAVRTFTTFMEVYDAVVLGGYVASTVLNAIIMGQILAYWKEEEKDKAE
jgi:mannose-P-dolichol utilization defect protein 1